VNISYLQKEEGRRKKEEGRRKKGEGRSLLVIFSQMI
jgi:hypothetical protein